MNVLKNKYIISFSVSIISYCCADRVKVDNEYYTLVDNDSVFNIIHEGKIKEQYQIINGQKNGYYKFYDKNLKVKEDGHLVRGKKDGIIKLYDSLDLLSVSYYENDKFIYDLDKKDFIYDTIKLSSFSLFVPKNWKSNLNASNGAELISHKNCDTSEIFCPVFSVTSEIANISLDSYCSKVLELMFSSVENIRLINKKKLTTNKIDIVQIRYSMSQGGKDIGFQTGVCKIKDKFFVLTGAAFNGKDGQFLKYDGLFQELILSVRE